MIAAASKVYIFLGCFLNRLKSASHCAETPLSALSTASPQDRTCFYQRAIFWVLQALPLCLLPC